MFFYPSMWYMQVNTCRLLILIQKYSRVLILIFKLKSVNDTRLLIFREVLSILKSLLQSSNRTGMCTSVNIWINVWGRSSTLTCTFYFLLTIFLSNIFIFKTHDAMIHFVKFELVRKCVSFSYIRNGTKLSKLYTTDIFAYFVCDTPRFIKIYSCVGENNVLVDNQ